MRARWTLVGLAAACMREAPPPADTATTTPPPASSAPAVSDTVPATRRDSARDSIGVSPTRDSAAAVGSDSGRRPLRPRPPHPVPRPMPRGDSEPRLSAGGDQAADRAALDRLKAEARALAHVTGCTSSGQCAVQALGERACGGPEEYVVYCPRSTDVAALARKADELARASRAFNAKYQIVSTCEYRVAPVPALVGGSCRAASSDGRATLPP